MDDFEALYRDYYDRVYFYVLGLCENEQSAEEITQDTFFKVLRRLDTFRGECKIGTWITQIAKNTFYDHCRRKKWRPEDLPKDAQTAGGPEELLLSREEGERIRLILSRMREPYREVFWMRIFKELSFKEIGAIHGKSESWARVTYHRAKWMIREELE